MKEIPFKVSARTARLIGRENIANSKSAVIELVKNSYDADSQFCALFFVDDCNSVEDEISIDVYNYLEAQLGSNKLLTEVYEQRGSQFKVKANASKKKVGQLNSDLSSLMRLYIVDNGTGMTEGVIEDYWMTIGTNNKLEDFVTESKKRIKSGAKGIGRFALDRLGALGHMYTYTKSGSNHLWKVNWGDFETKGKTIDKVKAKLDSIKDNYKERLKNILPKEIINKLPPGFEQNSGTILQIDSLRDEWDSYTIRRLYKDLENLVPPQEYPDFDIFLFDARDPDRFGQVSSSLCDDFDYKLLAEVDSQRKVKIELIRQEYDRELIPKKTLEHEDFRDEKYDKEYFEGKKLEIKTTLEKLLPGFAKVDKNNTLKQLGEFEFVFYFMKKGLSKRDKQIYHYRTFNAAARKAWLENFGGIRLFRDGFRVRPYGEVKSTSYDWLGLGSRKSRSPAGASKLGGGYKVNPDNVAGHISISRLHNLKLEDTASREGLQENDEVKIFIKIIQEIIAIFEKDRAYIARTFKKIYEQSNEKEILAKKAQDIADRISDSSDKEAQSTKERARSGSSEGYSESEVLLAKLNKEKDKRIEHLENEQRILRAMASSGLVMASFSHDLSKLETRLVTRIDSLEDNINKLIPRERMEKLDRLDNPLIALQKMRRQDDDVRNWLKFALDAAKKDKRKRKKFDYRTYFELYKEEWSNLLTKRNIDLRFEYQAEGTIRAFDIDMDSIFNNLIINSIESFINMKDNRPRVVDIKVKTDHNSFIMEYFDSGAGLSPDLTNPEEIFEPLFTTKLNHHTGDAVGTGLGMWIVKAIITEDYSGTVTLLYPKKGFGIRITIPMRGKDV